MSRDFLISEHYGPLGQKHSYYVENSPGKRGTLRHEKQGNTKSIFGWLEGWLRYALLPQGYPASVSSDYLGYQLWDTLQAFCSYLSGTLTTKAIMQGVGVGDVGATPLAATITWIMKDGTGMIGRIVFASWKGPSLDSNCKQWRLAADILNDLAMTIELCSPLLPETVFLWALCAATSMKSIVGVAGGCTRAALTQHQARRGNMADVAAKDGNQETLVNLVASIVGIFMLPLLQSDVYVWLLFMILTCCHLYANLMAVKVLNIPILNAQRFNLLLHSYYSSPKYQIDGPLEVNSKESVILGTGLTDLQSCGFQIKLGVSLSQVEGLSADQLKYACSLSNDYLVLLSSTQRTIYVVFRGGQSPPVLKAYFHAITLGMKYQTNMEHPTVGEPNEKLNQEGIFYSLFDAMEGAADCIAESFADFQDTAEKSGWIMSRHQLLVGEWQAQWNCSDDKKEN